MRRYPIPFLRAMIFVRQGRARSIRHCSSSQRLMDGAGGGAFNCYWSKEFGHVACLSSGILPPSEASFSGGLGEPDQFRIVGDDVAGGVAVGSDGQARCMAVQKDELCAATGAIGVDKIDRADGRQVFRIKQPDDGLGPTDGG